MYGFSKIILGVSLLIYTGSVSHATEEEELLKLYESNLRKSRAAEYLKAENEIPVSSGESNPKGRHFEQGRQIFEILKY